MPRKHKTHKVRWRDENGVHRQKSFRTRLQAEHFKRRLAEEKRKEPEVPPEESPTFAEYARRWIEDYAKLQKAESTAREDESVIRNHLVPAFGPRRLADLEKPDLVSLIRSMVSSGRSPKTVNNVVAIAKQIAAAAAEDGLIGKSPWNGVKKLRLTERTAEFWTHEERDRFLRFAAPIAPEFAEVVRLAVFSGLRKGEIAALRRSDVDFERGQIIPRRAYDFKSYRDYDRVKNRKIQPVPLNDGSRRALSHAKLMAPEDRVFRLALLKDANERLTTLCAKTQTTRIRFHDLRHTFASCLVMDGVPLYTVQRLMRHESIQMTERYAHLAPGFLQEASQSICRDGVRACAPEEKLESK